MKGIGTHYPVIGVAFTIFILGLIGVPATGGFLGKLLVFQSGMTVSTVGGLALVLILAGNSVLSLGYYVPVLSTILFKSHHEGHESARVADTALALSISVGVVILALATIYLGLFPAALYDWISRAAGQLYTWGVR
jgi:NADH:ubiquinone oxidoreductase subunit 2 (subunit N)